MNTSKIHINNLYIKYTFVHFAILLIRQVSRAVPLPVTISFALEALSFRLGSSFGLLHGDDNLFVILLEVPFLSLCPFLLGNVVISKKFLRTRKIMVMHSNERGECCPRTLVDRKRKRYDNAVDVVVCLHNRPI